ncbi:hypothetical protein FA13DRAFT_1808418 [Coprinellus micaceus]|uniref:Amino acid transporter transmembrane domain-containing protein n=1 Tax=Coprinellus micaceus TaxID=71717 RepID=A0A4Y7U273_COPMI|nr:hypothetical protein FA13DRAFT_1808418 [Coprinellus micaceus]
MAHVSAVAAVAASTNNYNSPHSQQKRPAPLDIPDDHEEPPRLDGRPRRLTISDTSDSEEDSPILTALDSSAALILVHDDSGEPQNINFDFSDDEDGEDDGDIVSPVFEIRRTSIPQLPPVRVFLYLLSPFLKLGALTTLTVADRLPLKYGLPALFVCAIASAFSRQVWYLLARYMRKADLMEIVCDTFAKSRRKEEAAEVYQVECEARDSESVRLLLPYLPPNLILRLLVVLLCGGAVFFLSLGQSLGSQRVVFASWLSILTYIAWLTCVIYAHAKGVLYVEDDTSSTWKGIFTIAFTFCTSSTLPLYASLKSGQNPISTAKTPKSRSFRVLSLFSVSCATLLVLPVVIFAALPNIPQTRSSSAQHSSSLSAATLLLGTAQPLLTIPVLPIRVARTNINLTHTLIVPLLIILTFALSLFPPPSQLTSLSITIITATTFALALASTYLLPCILHISVHTFKRPINIVIPRTPLLPTPSGSSGSGNGWASSGLAPTEARADVNELLQRKERALQQRQLRKRIVWDVGVWVQLGVFAVCATLALASLVSR